ncbi:divergent polysaccharide deacetylase family protein [Asticcacaulis sp. EMRT-3]|uniref:divergent polysaccharide deacetylase family protein n=1 Tax=Asticcacaulis sp. EMRT-3 TaxID=3040349 RepID=UPI0024AFBC23|nr:divergent polysaccharide deacetylase family protein [Asticcacaulis sp. EMRT-3]MDI7775739.1 divergent polysaccharide deacetylase family protein [Asticcacaulis sp. EMRT-3]
MAGLRAFGDTVMAFFRRPYVAPASAAAALVALIFIFLNVAGDPNAGSPSVRILLAKPKAAAPSSAIAPDDSQAGMQGFTLDSLGMFQDASADTFLSNSADDPAPSGTAVITLPGDNDGSTATASPKSAPSPLPVAPISGLVQATNNGPLPVIAPNGQTPASAYARPFRSDGRPMVALIIGGLGLNPATTKQAIDDLPPQVTLSFVPYTTGLQGWIDLARASGHEVMIEVPMQPTNYPDNDPGPQTLMANARPDDLISHLNWALSRATGYFAVSNYQGSAFFKDHAGMAMFLSNLKQRGVAFIDDGQARGQNGAWGRASADRIIDNQINASAIAAQLSGLESTAKSRGQALGTGFAYPVTLAEAIQWTRGLNAKGLQLAPASALAH